MDLQAGVAKLGQRRKIQGLILSGSGVQIPSPALLTLLNSPSDLKITEAAEEAAPELWVASWTWAC